MTPPAAARRRRRASADRRDQHHQRPALPDHQRQHPPVDPIGTSWADWTPRTGDPDWDAYLGALAAAADQRTIELGRAVADEAPAWALDTFGPVPADPRERAGWEQRAGVVAAYREFRGVDDDRELLGAAPKPGQVEAYAAYRYAWRVAGRLEIDQREHEMSDGLHRARIRAWEREQAWGPRYVGNELAGTRQAADQHRRTAAMRAAEADAAADPARQARLRTEAAQAAALAATVDARIVELEKLDDARAAFLVHTAHTRAAAEISEYILAERRPRNRTRTPGHRRELARRRTCRSGRRRPAPRGRRTRPRRRPQHHSRPGSGRR